MLIALSVSDCVTAGSYCDIACAARPFVADKMTEGIKRQILAETEKLARLRG
ncbi:hypothetical protein [Sinorhizobium sp. GL28]|uniref:hypothetical protein n=1 Tax=Sinorhizobium sp. GL28 TaxID=1358418 RepID=UPI000727D3E4|nr:hypothetical protein [Sinorhizobium sp. GL28]KSV88329.1 hypothetical protein N184_29560 [Sinorhizobium sp. GL28]